MIRIIILNILVFSVSFIKSNELDIELETELFLQFTNSYDIKSKLSHDIHYSAFLRNLLQHGNKLSQEKKIALKALGFNTVGGFITTSRPTLNNFIDDGLFRYHYNTVGSDAIDTTDTNSNNIPDYLDFIIKTFNDVSIINFDTLGFTYPPSDSWYTLQNNGGSSHYDIYIFNLEPGYYGYVQGESYSQNNTMINRGDNENSLDIKENSAMVTFMAIRNDYSSFTGNINEILQATISHEFFHAIQYGYDGWEAGWLLESTAVWMEELHYDHINDCYQFLEDNFDYPEDGLFKDTQRGYGSYIFFSYIEENYLDSKYVKNIFEKSIDYYSYDFDNSLSPVIDILTSNSLEITNVIKDLAISNVLLDGNAQPEIYQFEEADEYNGFGMYISNSITTIEDSVLTFDNESIWSTGSRFYKFINLDSTLESITVLLSDQDLNNEYYYLQTITKLDNGNYNIVDGLPQTVLSSYSDTLLFSVTYYIGYTLEPAKYSIQFIKNYLPTEDNKDEDEGNGELSLNIKQHSQKLHLYNPYPNPFNGNTIINYYLPEPQNITVEIHNVKGQKIRDLVNGYQTLGKYSVLWNSKDNNDIIVPSGIYFTILQGENNRFLNTITILK